ncbi:MAG TPA: PBP1A family penicillin-binding protein [Thermoanaerobaculia bacterium]|nr:PBP1A family penicillin-binding protein [Thermoanaerobaculia bacterium]
MSEQEPPETPEPPPAARWFSRFRKPTRRTVFRTISWTVGIGFILLAGLIFWAYRSAVGRFEVRRLRLPTRIYADYTPLTAGAPLQVDDLLEKLDRLGYREAEKLTQSGEYMRNGNAIDIFTREFRHPSGDYKAQQVHVVIAKSAIESVSAEKAALEPELLTSLLSEGLENRSPVTLAQVPKHMQDAVVATEDARFWSHPGVDPLGIIRALFRNVKAGGVAEGGSTLTQQLVKNYYLTHERTMKRKIAEAFMAVVLDARYSKREIIEAYLNDIYLGRNRSISILGVGEASRYYFGKPISEIKLHEAALIAGMIRSPNNYSPFTHPEVALKRRNTVLQLMLKQKKITQQEYDAAHSASLPRKPFRQKSGLSSIPFYVDRVLQELAAEYGIEGVKGRGLRIYTAIDLGAQDAAANTVETSLRNLEKSSRRLRNHSPSLEAALIHVDVPTGEIRALVGGRNYERSQFNRALKSKRLIGSLFKPFIYLTAFEPSLSGKNITAATVVPDTRFVLKRRWSADWSPRNYEGRYMGNVSVRMALEHSLNAASVRIGMESGIAPILKTARILGVDTEMEDSNPAILLGAVGIPPIEMAAAYTTIARQGIRKPLRAIRFVTDDRGRVVEGPGETTDQQVFPQRDVYVLTDVMKGVVDRGTAGRARSYGFKKIAAGKTGTTNDKRDAWFIGFTPLTLTTCWVGFDDNDPTGLSGSDAAVPMWTRYMLGATAGQPNTDFAAAPGISFVEIDETSGGIATPYCPRNVVVRQAFKSGTEPPQPCPLHMTTSVPVPMYDEFGNLITAGGATGVTGTTYPTDTTSTYVPPPPPPTTETTLTGGIFRTDTTNTTATTNTTETTDTTSTEPPVEQTDTATTRPPL